MRIMLLVAIVLVVIPILAFSQQDEDFVPNQIIISFDDKSPDAFSLGGSDTQCIYPELLSWLKQYGIKEIKEGYHGSKGVRNFWLITFDHTVDVPSIAASLTHYSVVRDASPNYRLHFLSNPNDYYYNHDWWKPGSEDNVRCMDQWDLTLMQANKAWDITRGDTAIVVGILDSGIDYFHPDLKKNIWVNPGEDINGNGAVWDSLDFNGEDDDGNELVDDLIGWDWDYRDNNPFLDTLYDAGRHGTMMASEFAVTDNDTTPADTSMAGLAWHCKIADLKTGTNIYNGTEAINYAIEKGFDVVNMSWYSIGYTAKFHDAIQLAHSNGIVVVAGDAMIPWGGPAYPACWPEVIAVGCVDETGEKVEGTAYHDYLDICGLGSARDNGYRAPTVTSYQLGDTMAYKEIFPGSQLPSCYYVQRGSVSLACAQVSAVAALIRSAYPYISSPDFIMSQIQRGAIPVDTAQGNIGQPWQYMLGAGRINPYRSLTQWGTIAENAIWNDRVYVSGDLRIAEGKTLTIEPGTTIYFAPDDNENMYDPTVLEFRVYGTLIAEGTASNPIVFKSFSQNPQPGDWSGIQVHGTGSASLSYCNISDAYHGIKSYRPVELSHCNISNCEVYGVYIEGGWANGSEISHCTTNCNGICGIMIGSCNNVSISDCESNNNYDGIWLTSSSGSSIENTQMKFNTGNGLKAVGSSWATLDWCTVEDNDQQGIYLSQSAAGISNTKIWKNTANGLYCVGASSQPMVDHSKIEQNAVGVRAASSACPILGDTELDAGQNNSIYNQPLFVHSTPNCTIKAENCWWGSGPGEMPSPEMFKGSVDYNPLLESDPVVYLAPSAPKKATILSLAQNYPNPSVGAGVTRITYSIPHENGNERVSLTIYDVNGRRIRTLVDDAKAAGTYQAYWDGKGERGQAVAPGIYFYKLTVGKTSISKKLILFR